MKWTRKIGPGLVVMLDTGDPPQLDEPPAEAEILALFLRDIAGLTGLPAPGLTAEDIHRIDVPVRVERALATLDVPDEMRPQLLERLHVFAANLRAAAVWRPSVYTGPVTLAVTGDRAGSWPQARALTRIAVPGDHFTMLRPPHLDAVVPLLRSGIFDG